MSRQKDHQHKPTPPPSAEDANEKLVKEAIEKYKDLYSYSTDILLKEHERFNRADDKASKFSTVFVFLIGAVAYFDKWIFAGLTWPDFPVGWPERLPLIAMGLISLTFSALGLFMAHHAISVRPIVSRPLNQEVLDFFERESRINIYYGLARENSNAYAENKRATDQKYSILKWLYRLMLLVLVFLVELVIMYCLYSWC